MKQTVCIVNYGMGNIGSIQAALAFLGAEARLVNTPGEILSAEKLILPGVGSFSQAMKNLREKSFIEPIREAAQARQVPLLGICLGMQLLADSGEEGGTNPGLGLIPGEIRKFNPVDKDLKIPHVGFNSAILEQNNPLFQGMGSEADFYFVHSFCYRPVDPATSIAWADYGGRFTAAVAKGKVMGTQFHPEKSQANGLMVLKNFLAV